MSLHYLMSVCFHLQRLIERELSTQTPPDLLIEEQSEPPAVVSVVTVNTFPLNGRIWLRNGKNAPAQV